MFGIGKRTQTQAAAASSQSAADTPGKQTQIGLLTGNALVDRGVPCEADPSGPGCTLFSPIQRTRMLAEYHQRVDSAMLFLGMSLDQLRTETLIERAEEHAPILGLLLFGGIAAILGMGFEQGMEALKSAGESALERAGVDLADESFRRTALEAIAKAPVQGIAKSAEIAIDVGREKTSHAMEGVRAGGEALRKNAVLMLIDSVVAQMPAIATALHEQIPARLVSDALIFLAWMQMAPERHSVAIYKGTLEGKIARFKMSGLAEMGSHPNFSTWHTDAVRVFWMDKTHRHLGLFERSSAHADGRDGAWEYKRPVEEEFREVAIEVCRARWGEVTEMPHEGGER